jgi:hypothetical protein
MTTRTGRNTLAYALNAASRAIRKFSIGRVLRPCCNWREGDYVLVDDSGDSLAVSSPMTPEEIDGARKEGSLLVDICTTIGVPRGYVEIVLSAEEASNLRGGAK